MNEHRGEQSIDLREIHSTKKHGAKSELLQDTRKHKRDDKNNEISNDKPIGNHPFFLQIGKDEKTNDESNSDKGYDVELNDDYVHGRFLQSRAITAKVMINKVMIYILLLFSSMAFGEADDSYATFC